MEISQDSALATRRFARVLGPYMVIVPLAAAARPSDTQAVVGAIDASGVWQLLTGVFALLAGLVIVGLHEHRRGPAAIIVSVVGWLAVLEGLVLLVVPRAYLALADWLVGSTVLLWVVMLVAAVIGAYLTYVGWIGERSVAQEPGSRARA